MKIENGKIYSKIRRKWLSITKEEKIRQRFVDYLLDELKIPINFLEEEKSIKIGSKGSKTIFADLVIWKNDIINKDIVIEFKAPNENLFEAKNQIISYAKLLNFKNVLISNGLKEKNKIFFVRDDKNEKKWEETYDFIESFIKKEKVEKKPFDKEGLLKILSELNNDLRTNSGLNDFDAFREINKLIFCKIFAEKKYQTKLNYGPLNHAFVKEHSFKGQTGIIGLFNELKDNYYNDEVFHSSEEIELNIKDVELILMKLNTYNFLATKEDIKGMVYEHFISQELRGNLGQFFTPRVIIEFILKYLKIKKDDKICDPACGTGGFLINHFKSFRDKLNKEELKKLINNIHGFDFNETLAKVAKMNMILHGDGHVNIHKQNSLLLDKKNEYDFIVTNPPFGSNNVKDEIVIKFNKLIEFGIKTKKTEILFLEKIYEMLKPKGKAGIVLPLGVLNNKNDKKIREFIIKHFNVELVFRIPKNLFFNAKTTIQTCVLILVKKEKPKINNFNTKMFYINDKNFSNYNDYIYSTKEKFKNVFDNNFKEDFLVDISKNNNYKLDPGYYITNNEIQKECIKISDILEVYKKEVNIESIKNKNIKTIKSIDSNGKVNLHEKINKTGPYFLVDKNTFFYSRLAAYKGSFIYWEKENIVITGEYPTLKIKKDVKKHPKIIELLLTNEYFLNKYYWLATGQGRIRLQIEDFLNIKIPNKMLEMVSSESNLLLNNINNLKNIENNIEKEKIRINNLIQNKTFKMTLKQKAFTNLLDKATNTNLNKSNKKPKE